MGLMCAVGLIASVRVGTLPFTSIPCLLCCCGGSLTAPRVLPVLVVLADVVFVVVVFVLVVVARRQ